MRLIAIEYPERRLNYFKEQLAAAHRRLDWSMKHNPDWNDHAEKGEVVSFYEWAVQMAEGNCEAVVRCKDCIYFHKEHVLCNDGTEKDFSEFPPEAFGLFGDSVTSEYGINVGSKCEIDKNNGYGMDKSVFRRKDDFCSRGKRKDGEG